MAGLRGLWQTVWLGAALVVLALSPRYWTRPVRHSLGRQIVLDTAPVLPGFTALAALLTLVITRIVIVSASTYGLSQYAIEMVIRVLVLELLPLTAALFVALRCTIPSGAALGRIRRARPAVVHEPAGLEALLWPGIVRQALPRMVSGVFAGLTLAALTCVVATVLVYLAVYGPALAGFEPFTRVFGRVFDPSMSLILALKTLAFAFAVSAIPMALAIQQAPAGGPSREARALQGLVRLLAVLLVLETVSLVGNYY